MQILQTEVWGKTRVGREKQVSDGAKQPLEPRNGEKAGWSERQSTESLPRKKEIKKRDELLAEVGKFNRGGWKIIIEEIGVGGSGHGM